MPATSAPPGPPGPPPPTGGKHRAGISIGVENDSSTVPPIGAATAQRDQRRPEGIGALQGDTFRMAILRSDRYFQHLLDRIAPFKLYRWLGLIALLLLFLLRMVILEGFYIVAYVLFIFILNQFILFLQPKDRAALLARTASAANSDSTSATDDAENRENALPTLDDEEFRPFVRRLPEFKFWYSTTYATFLSLCATFFTAFDVPVFWPLLLFYFIVLFVATMRRQWLDMKRLKYVPWDIGNKKVYKSDPKRVSVVRAQAPSAHNVVAASGRAPTPVPTIPVNSKKPVPAVAANGAAKSSQLPVLT